MPSQSQNVDADTLVVDVDRIVEKLVDDSRFIDLVESLISNKKGYFAEKWVETRKHIDLPKKDPDTESIRTKLETQREKYNKEEQVNFEAPETLYRVYKCQKGDCSSWRIQKKV